MVTQCTASVLKGMGELRSNGWAAAKICVALPSAAEAGEPVTCELVQLCCSCSRVCDAPASVETGSTRLFWDSIKVNSIQDFVNEEEKSRPTLQQLWHTACTAAHHTFVLSPRANTVQLNGDTCTTHQHSHEEDCSQWHYGVDR
jgi:hypothetical protein